MCLLPLMEHSATPRTVWESEVVFETPYVIDGMDFMRGCKGGSPNRKASWNEVGSANDLEQELQNAYCELDCSKIVNIHQNDKFKFHVFTSLESPSDKMVPSKINSKI